MIRFIDVHRPCFGVGPICRVLQFAPSTYYTAGKRPPSARQRRDEQFAIEVQRVHRGTITGTPQGGILSPLLANIALSCLDEHFARKWAALGPEWKRAKHRRAGGAIMRLVRYADDFVILVSGTRADAEGSRREGVPRRCAYGRFHAQIRSQRAGAQPAPSLEVESRLFRSRAGRPLTCSATRRNESAIARRLPVGGSRTADELAAMTVYLTSAQSDFVTAVMRLDGGLINA